MGVQFLLNGETVRVDGEPATRTLLDWLRETRGLKGTKEGCNEGDCGACTVMVTDGNGSRAVNSCILFLPQLHGKAVRTVEGISGPDGQLHPVQNAMVHHHGSQCGFCTPGFVVSMAVAHKNARSDHDNQLAGNLCRCTGYAPIVRAAEAARKEPVPDWMTEDLSALKVETPGFALPTSTDELALRYEEHPDAVLIGGATDVGLWVTKRLDELDDVIFLHAVEELNKIDINDAFARIGATVSIADFSSAILSLHPDLSELLRRYGSVQVRNAATLGGNIANGSPIGDSPPALIALGATLHLRKGPNRREIPIENFFLDYGKQDRSPGEFIEAISIPRQKDRLKCYKVSKRFDQDISSVCGCFSIYIEDGKVVSARIAFGGMAAIPKRAFAVEAALQNQTWTDETVKTAMALMDKDFTPMSDMRSSSEYRMQTARNLLLRYYLEDQGQHTRVLATTP